MKQKGKPTQRAPDAGDSMSFSGIFYALAFFQLDGFIIPAPAQVTPTVIKMIDGKLPLYPLLMAP
jgi:hypothetical protein